MEYVEILAAHDRLVSENAKLRERVGELENYMRCILGATPRYGLDPSAKVGSPHAITWNVHGIARAALDLAKTE